MEILSRSLLDCNQFFSFTENFPHGLRELRHTGRRINFLLSSERSESKVIQHRLSVTLFTREYGIYRLKTLFWLNNCILILIFSVRRFLPAFLKFPGLPSFNPVPHSHPNNKKSEEANLFFVTSTRTTLGEFFSAITSLTAKKQTYSTKMEILCALSSKQCSLTKTPKHFLNLLRILSEFHSLV